MLPGQIDAFVAVAVTVGSAFTVTVTCAVDVHEFAPVPVTVYVVVVVGETVTEVPLNEPGFQVYDEAPEPVSVADPPLQIAAFELVAVTFGEGLTVTVTCAVLLHPPFDPVTV